MEWMDINAARVAYNTQGMWVLGTWVLLNFLVSGWLYGRTSGPLRYFHQMNVFWNLVNLMLVAYTLWQNAAAGSAFNLPQTIAEQYLIEKLFLFNAGLDVGYVMLGFFLAEKAKTAARRPERLRGWGYSVILQGGFLFLFDWVMFFRQASITERLLDQLAG
ncbi:MAG: hypothetical protein MUC97_06175 [Bernardetiaceae bacterium]|jgi:hypothetical protein|nr:hypothetical protein [Bernardetiaceae bacterium]